MDINAQKEQFSIAYIHAICSVAGYSCSKPTVDDHSIDLDIKASNRPFHQIGVQIKATANEKYIKDDFIHFPLPIKNYNDLRGDDVAVPRYLICLTLPNDNPENWIKHSQEELLLMKCAYWVSLRDYKVVDNRESVTVRIPLKNTFTPEALKTLITNRYS